jgi:hypothetical protein
MIPGYLIWFYHGRMGRGGKAAYAPPPNFLRSGKSMRNLVPKVPKTILNMWGKFLYACEN